MQPHGLASPLIFGPARVQQLKWLPNVMADPQVAHAVVFSAVAQVRDLNPTVKAMCEYAKWYAVL